MQERVFRIMAVVLLVVALSPQVLFASTIDDLKKKISDRGGQIEQLEAEIIEQEKQIIEVGKEKNTLQSHVNQLDLTERKIGKDIKLTQNRISSTNNTIEKIGLEIGDKESKIIQNKTALGSVLRKVDEMYGFSLIELLLLSGTLGEFWEETETLDQFERGVHDNVALLEGLKVDLGSKQEESRVERAKLSQQKNQLSDQKKVVTYNKQERVNVLVKTKNKESEYKKILDETIALRETFERELFAFESQLQFEIDPDSFPTGKPGILANPLRSMLVTQKFGATDFAKKSRYYRSGSHPGTDFRASVGTTVYSALAGSIIGAGDTDSVRSCRGRSFGKWVLVEHPNGLSTLYAHLSVISVEKGQGVGTGTIVGYSGNTGVTTAAHLHFGVYASQGVKVGNITSATCGKAPMPIADTDAYLDPEVYLP
ncbi:hypothetical protein COB55_02125 [Candidatus Wolfebacteria bacterium]|nr:MAG: hypothetical protein COB55_02125 [Candidatus Wolfebacteria bacterium]